MILLTSETTGVSFKAQTVFESPGKHLSHPESDLGVTSDVTGLIEVKNIDISTE